MKSGAARRMNASWLACPGRIYSAPAFSAANEVFTRSSVLMILTPSSSAMSVFTAGGISSITVDARTFKLEAQRLEARPIPVEAPVIKMVRPFNFTAVL
jgi:hypothetical protein